MSELTDWLLSQIAADEQTARAAMTVVGDDLVTYEIGDWWAKVEHGRVYAGHWHKVVQAGETLNDPPVYNTAALEHIAAHDPGRVLALCAVLRRIVEEHGGVDPCDAHDGATMETVPCDTLRALASAFAGRPGFKEEWAHE